MRTAEVGGVDVLAARARGAERVDAAIALVDVDLDPVVDDRIDPDGREAGVPAGIESKGEMRTRRCTPRLRLQPSIGIVALDLERGALDAGFLAVGHVHDLDLVLPLLGPADVHAHEHVGPILALRAAGAGMDFEKRVVPVRLAGEQRLDLTARGLGLHAADRDLAFMDGGLVALGVAELDQGRRRPRGRPPACRSTQGSPQARCVRASPFARLRVSFQRLGSSARAFSSARRRLAVSTSKMPPQQSHGLLGGIEERFDFGAHRLISQNG